MQLVNYGPPGQELPGLLTPAGIVPLSPLAGDAGMEEVIADWDSILPDTSALLESTQPLDLAAHRLGPPLTRPQKIVGVGANYRSVDGQAPQGPVDPILFFKPASSLAGPVDPVILPIEAASVVAEVELAIVIGRRGHRVSAAEAASYIFGYTIANDITAPEIMLGDSHLSPLFFQQGRGKGFPGFCPLGPCIVTADEFDDLAALELRQEIDGIVELEGKVALMRHTIAELVSEMSHAFGLEPGDVILSGSPRPPAGSKRRALRDGQVLGSIISGIGALSNPIVAEADLWPGQPLRRYSAGGEGY